MCRARSGGLHIQGSVGIDLDTVCAGSDILDFERSGATFSDLLRAVSELKQASVMGHNLDIGGEISFLSPQPAPPVFRGVAAQSNCSSHLTIHALQHQH